MATNAREDDWISWRWIAGAACGGLLIGGLFLARGAASEAVYDLGLAVSCAAGVAIYALIAASYGSTTLDRLAQIDPMPANGTVRFAVGGVAGGIALWALFQASGATGFAYDAGLGLFGAAVLYDFLLIKDWFDRDKNRANRT